MQQCICRSRGWFVNLYLTNQKIYSVLRIHWRAKCFSKTAKRELVDARPSIAARDGMHLFRTSILIRSCWSAPLLLLGKGALYVLFTHCLVWPIIKTLVNGACSPHGLLDAAGRWRDSKVTKRDLVVATPSNAAWRWWSSKQWRNANLYMKDLQMLLENGEAQRWRNANSKMQNLQMVLDAEEYKLKKNFIGVKKERKTDEFRY